VTVTVWPATVSVAERDVVAVLASAVYVTVPLPVPLAPLVIVSHETDSVAVHVQPLVVVTVTFAVPPLADNEVGLSGETVNAHGAASWVTVTVWPATVNVVDREVVAVFAAAVYDTVPLPEPLVALVMVSHVADSVAVQVQPVDVVTVTLALPPPAASEAGLSGATVNAHGAASCVTVTV
jgi:hypothetical protein